MRQRRDDTAEFGFHPRHLARHDAEFFAHVELWELFGSWSLKFWDFSGAWILALDSIQLAAALSVSRVFPVLPPSLPPLTASPIRKLMPIAAKIRSRVSRYNGESKSRGRGKSTGTIV